MSNFDIYNYISDIHSSLTFTGSKLSSDLLLSSNSNNSLTPRQNINTVEDMPYWGSSSISTNYKDIANSKSLGIQEDGFNTTDVEDKATELEKSPFHHNRSTTSVGIKSSRFDGAYRHIKDVHVQSTKNKNNPVVDTDRENLFNDANSATKVIPIST